MAGKPVITDEVRIGAIKRKQAAGMRITKEDILSVKDAQTRQKLIAENIELFAKKQ